MKKISHRRGVLQYAPTNQQKLRVRVQNDLVSRISKTQIEPKKFFSL
ncbi:MAG: hypothetical protein ACYTXP_12330 [Nostoc sp.]